MRKPERRGAWEARSLSASFMAMTVIAVVVLIAPTLVVLLTSFTDDPGQTLHGR